MSGRAPAADERGNSIAQASRSSGRRRKARSESRSKASLARARSNHGPLRGPLSVSDQSTSSRRHDILGQDVAMRLLNVQISGFRRLDGVRLNVDGRIIAIVGPNEAGKSSVLDALLFSETGEALRRRDRTHRLALEEEHVVIRSTYLLDGADRDALAAVVDAGDARYFVREKLADGSVRSSIRPTPARDLAPRRTALLRFQRLTTTARLREAALDDEDFREALDRVAGHLRSEAQSLTQEQIVDLTAMAAQLDDDQWPRSARQVAALLSQLVAHEVVPHPHGRAREVLQARRPVSVLFTTEDRNLRDSYELDDLDSEVPRALSNLAAVANLALPDLIEAADARDNAAKESIIREANDRLRSRFAESWGQSQVAVQLSIEDRTLNIFASGHGNAVTSVAERSDGLRAFIGLLSFLASADVSVPPLLLIDEAEQHLHYDAQADLVRMLTRQRAASQVLYTTHSAGCLPEDFGAAVRVVVPGSTPERSEARNAYWESDTIGFDSLLLAMGASTFAFAATRRSVLAEGPTEVILLPRLLREAIGDDDVGFQVAPGLAVADRVAAGTLDLAAARVAFFVDNDQGGADIARLLRQAGIDGRRIVSAALRGAPSNDLEDLLDAAVYAKAVNEELRRSHGDKVVVAESGVPRTGKTATIAAACARHGVRPPNKTAVARRLVEMESDVPLLSRSGAAALRTAHAKLVPLLN